MNFLAPLYFLGAMAVVGPVIFHLIRQTTRDRQRFSSLMFLSPSPPRLTRRSRLEHLLLLALRCAVLALLAFGFARPFFRTNASTPPSANRAGRTVVLVDASASMRRTGAWAEAREKAIAAARAASPSDRVAVYVFDRKLTPIVTFEEWEQTPPGNRAGVAGQKLAALTPGWASTRTSKALIETAELLMEASVKDSAVRSQITLVSDLQEGSYLDGLQGYQWPKNVALAIESVTPRRSSNASLQLAPEASDTQGQTRPATTRVRVTNAQDSKKDQFTVGWAGSTNRVHAYVPAGQNRTLAIAQPTAGAQSQWIDLQGDDEDFDNRVAVASPDPAKLMVLYLGNEDQADPKGQLYFISRAFQKTRDQQVEVLAQNSGALITEESLSAATLIIAGGPLTESQLRGLGQAIQNGKTVLLTLTGPDCGETLAGLAGSPVAALEEARVPQFAMPAEIDFKHPLLAPFADPRFSDFTKIRFWKYRKLDPATLPGARTLIKFDSGDPALLEVVRGKGHLLVLTAGWGTDDGQLALSTKFVPLLYTLLEQSGAPLPPPPQFFAGDVVNFSSFFKPGSAGTTVRTPAGDEVRLPAESSNFAGTLTPGVYQVQSGESHSRFVVNVDPRESRLLALTTADFEKLGAPVKQPDRPVVKEQQRLVQLQNTELENRQKLWQWIILAVLMILVFETWLAGRTGRLATAQPSANK